MPTVAERLKHITLKVERAKKHISDLNAEIIRFLATTPYEQSAKRDSQTRRPIYYVSAVSDTPDVLALIAGDAINNLISALDHLAYELVSSDTAQYPPPRHNAIDFPIGGSDANEFKTIRDRRMPGASPATLAAIDTIKPYKGGNDLLWSLQGLNNIDKHRLLITVGAMFHSVDLGAHLLRVVRKRFGDPASPIPGKDIPVEGGFLAPVNAMFPLKVGAELFSEAPDVEIDEYMDFRFSVALYEPGIIEQPKSIVEVMDQFTALVEGIVTALTPRLRDIP
jgi:hypothetical protein